MRDYRYIFYLPKWPCRTMALCIKVNKFGHRFSCAYKNFTLRSRKGFQRQYELNTQNKFIHDFYK